MRHLVPALPLVLMEQRLERDETPGDVLASLLPAGRFRLSAAPALVVGGILQAPAAPLPAEALETVNFVCTHSGGQFQTGAWVIVRLMYAPILLPIRAGVEIVPENRSYRGIGPHEPSRLRERCAGRIGLRTDSLSMPAMASLREGIRVAPKSYGGDFY